MSDFATRLKKLRKEKKLRQIDLAGEMGVAQTTIANYEQHSRFPDEETLRKLANYLDVSLDYLLGRSEVSSRMSELMPGAAEQIELSDLGRKYTDQLLAGRKEEAYSLVINAAKNGMPVRSIYTQIFEPALKEVGRLWEINGIDVAREHYFSEATGSLIGELRSFQMKSETYRGVIISVAVSSEFHQLGIRMITEVLEEEGWKTYYVGVNTPTADLVKAVLELNANILAISATMTFHTDSVSNMILHIKSAMKKNKRNLNIVVGGQAFSRDKDLWKRVGADGHAAGLDDAVQLINSFGREQ